MKQASKSTTDHSPPITEPPRQDQLSSVKKAGRQLQSQQSHSKDARPEGFDRRQSGTRVQRKSIRLLPDVTTQNLKVLKTAAIAKESGAEITSKLSEQYKARKQSLDRHLQKVIDNSKIAMVDIHRKNEKERHEEEQRKKEKDLENQKTLQAMGLAPTREKDPGEDILANGFVRSKRSQNLRVKDEILNQIACLEQEKIALIQKLNKALLDLDKINESKKDVGNQLLEQVKFVRDLQRAASNGDDIDGIISVQMKTDFKREKELNSRLMDELKRCEQERLKLLQRIKLLSGEKEVVVQSSDGLQKRFKVTQVNIRNILDELKASKDRVTSQEDLIRQTRDMVRVTEDEILERQRVIEGLLVERDTFSDKILQLESRYQLMFDNMEGDRFNMASLHRMHVKLLATRQFEESLQKVLSRRRRDGLYQMLKVTRGYVNQFGAVYRLRRALISSNHRLQRNALAKWYKIACDPIMLVKQNQDIPKYFSRVLSHTNNFHREFEGWMVRNYQNHQKETAVMDAGKVLDKFWRRNLRAYFERWKAQLSRGNQAIDVLKKHFSRHRQRQHLQAFSKWKQFVVEQNFAVRMQGMSVMVACNRLLAMTFFSWRSMALSSKRYRNKNLKEGFRRWKKRVQQWRHLKKMALAALMQKRVCNTKVLQGCLDALKINVFETRKEVLLTGLEQQAKPMVVLLKDQVDNINELEVINRRFKATRVLVNLARNQIRRYFAEWKAKAKFVTVALGQRFLQASLRQHRDRLMRGFAAFKDNIQHKEIVQQLETLDQEYIQKMDLQEINRKTDKKIQVVVQHGRSQGNQRMKRFAREQFDKRLRQALQKWHAQVQFLQTKEGGAHQILRKIRMRLLRIAWNRYRECVACKEFFDRSEKRISEVKLRLQLRQQRVIFKAIYSFAKKFKYARKFLRNMISRLDRFNKNVAFGRWAARWFDKKMEIKDHNYAQKIEETFALQRVNGNVGNELQQVKDRANRVQKAFKTQCQKTLQKWACRLINASLVTALNNWKDFKQFMRHREAVLKRTRLRQVKNLQLLAIFRWRACLKAANIMVFEETVSEQSLTLGCNISEFNQISQKRQDHIVRSGRERKQILDEKDLIEKKKQKIIDSLADRNTNNFFTSRRRDIFNRWRKYARDRRQAVRRLVTMMTHTVGQTAFNNIRSHANTTYAREDYERMSGKMIKLIQRSWLKHAMNRWRESEYISTVLMTETTIQKTDQVVDELHLKVENVKKHHGAVCSGKQDTKMLQIWFDNLRRATFEARDTRLRTAKIQQATSSLKAKKALLRWKLRTAQTIKVRAFLKRAKAFKKSFDLRNTFLGWKREFFIRKQFVEKIVGFANQVKHFRVKEAFSEIQAKAAEFEASKELRRRRTMTMLLSGMGRYCDNKTRLYFTLWKKLTDVGRFRGTKLKAALVKIEARRARQYFDRWHSAAMGESTRLFHEVEEGPTNLECWKLRQKNLNLVSMLKEDGITNAQIVRIQQDIEDRYKAGIEKSLCRLLCKQEDDLQLLPVSFDRWKKYYKIRKVWRRVLNDCEIRLAKHEEASAKLWAFRRLQYTYSDRQEVLKARPIPLLRSLAVKGVEELDQLADNVEFGEQEKKFLIDQRAVLLKKHISAQKMALALGRDNRQMGKFKALSALQTYGSQRIQSKIEMAIQANLDRISRLKDTITMTEQQNEELARQNDQFRKGALDGITMVRHVEALTHDRDKLSVDLADKAITIRKLLEDNSFLRGKLDKATAERQRMESSMAQSRSQDHPTRERNASAALKAI